MSLLVTAEVVPLASDADGVVRVGFSRVSLDTVVAAFREGMTPEGIVEQYPSLQLAAVYSVIGYVLALLARLRVSSRPEELPLVSAGYRAEVERMQREVLDYLTQPATPTAKAS